MLPRPIQSFKVKTGNKEIPAGTVVYELSGYDYGLANDDTRNTGIKHISVTFKPDGGYPSFTHFADDLIPLPSNTETNVPSTQDSNPTPARPTTR